MLHGQMSLLICYNSCFNEFWQPLQNKRKKDLVFCENNNKLYLDFFLFVCQPVLYCEHGTGIAKAEADRHYRDTLSASHSQPIL